MMQFYKYISNYLADCRGLLLPLRRLGALLAPGAQQRRGDGGRLNTTTTTNNNNDNNHMHNN